MVAAVETPKMVGTRVKRREDPRLITGRGTYVDDIELVRMGHMAVVRSEYGHARIAGRAPGDDRRGHPHPQHARRARRPGEGAAAPGARHRQGPPRRRPDRR